MKMTTNGLREMINSLFENCEDRETIMKVGQVNQAIDDIEAETKAQQDDYKKLLTDYKDVVLHSSFKPQNNVDNTQPSPVVDADKVFDEIFGKYR